MNKSDIQKFRIDILSGSESALSLMLARDGTLGRQGNGTLPVDKANALGDSDGSTFKTLIDQLDERVFPHADVYDHPHKIGIPITYSIAFLDKHEKTVVFEFRFGSETPDVGELLPYFDGFIAQAVALTDTWYAENKVL
jgi:hypothetical protein